MNLDEAKMQARSAAVTIATWPNTTVRPTCYADKIGTEYAAMVSADHRKNHGLYLTAVAVADFIGAQATVTGENIRVLDPAAGAGILLCALVESLSSRPNPP